MSMLTMQCMHIFSDAVVRCIDELVTTPASISECREIGCMHMMYSGKKKHVRMVIYNLRLMYAVVVNLGRCHIPNAPLVNNSVFTKACIYAYIYYNVYIFAYKKCHIRREDKITRQFTKL